MQAPASAVSQSGVCQSPSAFSDQLSAIFAVTMLVTHQLRITRAYQVCGIVRRVEQTGNKYDIDLLRDGCEALRYRYQVLTLLLCTAGPAIQSGLLPLRRRSSAIACWRECLARSA